MKKTLLLLLFTAISFAQTGVLTPVDRLRIKTPQELSTNTQVLTRSTTTGETGFVAKTDLQDVLKFTTASALPTNGVVGKFYYTIDNNKYYAFNGTIYKEVGASAITGLTTNYLTKWNGTGFGNSQIAESNNEYYFDTPNGRLTFGNNATENYIFSTTTLFGSYKKIKIAGSGMEFLNGASSVFSITPSGNTLFGKTTDAGDGIIQANGNITASPATASNHVVVKSQLDTKQNAITGLTANRLTKSNGTDIVNSAYSEVNEEIFIGGKKMLSDYSWGGADNNAWLGGASNTTVTGTSPGEGNQNVAVGRFALSVTTTGFSNVALGVDALRFNTSGSQNFGLGSSSLYSNTTGSGNVAIGTTVLAANTIGGNNVGVGSGSLRYNTSGSQNMALGGNSLFNNTIGNNNVAVGYNALSGTISGSQNIGFGNGSLSNLTSGSLNLAIGGSSGALSTSGNLTTSNNSIFLGDNSRALANNSSNEIVIGSGTIGEGSNSVTLGNASIIRTVLRGRTLVNTTVDDGVNAIQANGAIKSTSSVQVGNNTNAASVSNVGAIRYRESSNNSYIEMCVRTGTSTYTWKTINTETW